MKSSPLLLLLLTLLPTSLLSSPTTRSITGTFSTPPAPTRPSEQRRPIPTLNTHTSTTPHNGNPTKGISTSSWETAATTSQGTGIITGPSRTPDYIQKVNRPYCIINGQFYYAGPQKIYFGCFFVCECLGYGEFACSPLCKAEDKPCPSNTWKKERKGCCDEYVCLG